MELPIRRGLWLVLAAFCFLIILQDIQNNNPGESVSKRRTVEAEKHALDILSKSHYGDFDPQISKWLNITGLRADDGLHWRLLPQVNNITSAQRNAILNTEWIQTGRRKTRHLGPEDLWKYAKALKQSDGTYQRFAVIPYYQHITGYVHGDWIRSRIIPPGNTHGHITSSAYQYSGFARNVTGFRGHFSLSLDEQQSISLLAQNNLLTKDIKAKLEIEDTSGNSWDIRLKGVHFTETGSAILTTTSDRYAGLFALPHLLPSKNQFERAQALQNKTLLHRITRTGNRVEYDDKSSDSANDIQEEMFPVPQCDYVVYLQQHLVWPFESENVIEVPINIDQKDRVKEVSYLEMLETELQRPTGRSLNFIPKLRFSATIFSPDCGFVLESDGSPDGWYHEPGLHLNGDKTEVFIARVKKHVIMYALVVLAQVLLLTRQIQDSSTPSTRSRVSFYTIGMMAMADYGVCKTTFVLSVQSRSSYLPLLSVSFFLFLSVPFYGVKFLNDIWTIQAPEREERERQRAAIRELNIRSNRQATNDTTVPTNNIPMVVVTPAGADLLPLPVTARRHNDNQDIQVILPPDQDIDAMMAEDDLLHGPRPTTNGNSATRRFDIGIKFFALSFCLSMLSFSVSLWPLTLRTIYTNCMVFCYFSFWVPQIRRNMLRNCRKALRWEYVIGQSLLRLVPLAYLWVYEDNILIFKTDVHAFAVFAAWQWAQILLLLSQDVLGPRFFLPSGILPPAYDYHQVLREGDEEDGGFMPIGFTQDGLNAAGESKERGTWLSDCIICMHTLEAHFVPRGDSENVGQGSSSAAAVSNIFARRDYMITPCRHIFHTHCLDGWMKYKLQCPICRESLPPL